ncbi:DinB family protein [Kineosporia rhizophila]|uniref:DinB family protein n=1 Tax=Kineosporia rhizophila TaxID=84633 RepID=UPI000AD6A2F8|nr:DinB family protein [Kineosporia rhizophila]MCE0536274.1 DinB family protein [Kineosporia rhizophila]
MSFDGMWMRPGDDPREAIPPGRGEKAVLAEYLDRYRMTFELKCAGLTAAQLATRSVTPSTMSLLGLVRHLARVEHSWTRRVFEGQPELPRLYRTEDDPDLDFNQAIADDEVVAEAWATWRGEVAHARAVYAGLDLDALIRVDGQEVEARDIVVHLVEEYARHVGHADLLREALDGRTGQ